MSKPIKTKKGMSNGLKWIITFALVILAVSTVIICARKGAFHFEATITANDNETMETAAPEDNEEADDESGNSKYTVFVTAGNGGTVNPTGSITVDAWDSINLSFTPDAGYVVQSVTIDGKEIGAVENYTISYIESNHTVVATFDKVRAGADNEDDGSGESSSTSELGNIADEITNNIVGIIEKIVR